MGEVLTPQKSIGRSNKLTARYVMSVSEPGRYHDGGGVGLYLRADQGGAKFWVQRIMVNGKRRELGLGSPPVTTLAHVRETALENKRMVRAGIDPLQAKQEAHGIPTFEEATYKVYDLNKPTWNNPKHAAQFISTLQTYAFPKIGQLKISDIATSDVMAVLTPFWTVKPETARRVRQRIGVLSLGLGCRVFNLGITHPFRSGDTRQWAGDCRGTKSKCPVAARRFNHRVLC